MPEPKSRIFFGNAPPLKDFAKSAILYLEKYSGSSPVIATLALC
jgi:hypothetical protein